MDLVNRPRQDEVWLVSLDLPTALKFGRPAHVGSSSPDEANEYLHTVNHCSDDDHRAVLSNTCEYFLPRKTGTSYARPNQGRGPAEVGTQARNRSDLSINATQTK